MDMNSDSLNADVLNTDELLSIAFDAVTATATRTGPSEGLEEQVLTRVLAGEKPRRHPGWNERDRFEPKWRRADSLDAFIKTAAELSTLFDSLSAGDWTRTTRIEGASVRQIVEHLVGVERYLLGCLDRRPRLDAPRREDHWPVSRRAATGLAGEPDETVSQSWWSEVLNLIAACAELGPDHALTYHHLAGTLQGLLVVRTFELWTHGNDIRDAIGRPADDLDEARLSLMVDELMRVLPLGLALSGCPQPGRTARLRLTGAGGGSFDVSLDPTTAVGRPDITLTADVIDLCRLAANRLAPDALDVIVEGDRRLLEPVLVGATAFAAD
ncbi:MAG TPA: maleylpyruvate isomerase family mycothiol-dependent enzyme [Acidimicrobiales bacterium]|nr:maleylpyruvate isomerase family mycothiol-dependent enzyme [Acidimicrobiales bacterium]